MCLCPGSMSRLGPWPSTMFPSIFALSNRPSRTRLQEDQRAAGQPKNDRGWTRGLRFADARRRSGCLLVWLAGSLAGLQRDGTLVPVVAVAVADPVRPCYLLHVLAVWTLEAWDVM